MLLKTYTHGVIEFILRIEEPIEQNFAPNMYESTPINSNRYKHFLVPIVLVIVLLTSLFSVVGNQEDANPKPKTLFVADTIGGDPSGGGGGCMADNPLTRAYYQAVQEEAALGHLWAVLIWDGWVANGGPNFCRTRNPNPGVILKCEKPEITVALMIDRSNSVLADGTHLTPAIFKQSLRTLIDEFFRRFTPPRSNGSINFLVYAFGTKSVLQNESSSPTPTLTNIVTDASTASGRQDLLDTIDNIWFRDDANFPNKNDRVAGFQSRTLNPSDLARAYDAGSETAAGEYGKTNWQDAFIQVMEAAAHPKYNNSGDAGIGKRIDLAVMVTDGLPTADNSWDWNWTPGTFRGSDTTGYDPTVDGINYSDGDSVLTWNQRANSSDPIYHTRYDDLYRITTKSGGRQSAQNAIDMLRGGINPSAPKAWGNQGGFGPFVRNIPARPPVSVKGIVINTSGNATEIQDSKDYAELVFDPGNYFFATDFTTTLEEQIESLVTNVIDESNCPELNNPVVTSISLDTVDNKTTAKPVEGDPEGDTISFIITNNGDGPLTNVKLCVGELDLDESNPGMCHMGDDEQEQLWKNWGIASLEPGESHRFTFDKTFYADFGDANNHFKVWAIGESTADDFLPGNSKYPRSDTRYVFFAPIRRNLPA